MTDAVAATIDHAAIARLLAAYADAITRHDWPALADQFLPDAVVSVDLVTRPAIEVVGPQAFGEFVDQAIARFDFFEFVVLNAHVDLWPGGDRDAATARVFMCELRRLRGEVDRSDIYGLYRDDYARTPAGWRFARRRYQSLGRWPGGEVFPLPAD